MSDNKSVFQILNSIDVNGHTEKKKDLTYLSWAWAYAEMMKRYPDMSYTIERFGEEKRPYLYDENLGYMVFTTVTVEGVTKEMWLPVMDGNNKAMKDKPYTYDTKFKKDLKVESATMFDINKTIMRCLVKNMGMFGLGLYIYAGEDLPEEENNTKSNQSTASNDDVTELATKVQDYYKSLNENYKKIVMTSMKQNKTNKFTGLPIIELEALISIAEKSKETFGG